jgi:hypothetical protein
MSPMMIIAPLIGFAAFGWMMYRQKTMGATHDVQHSNFRASELASRLGLTLVKGDPAFNLFIAYADAGVRKGPTDDKPVDVDVLLQGQPQGVPIEVVYYNRIEQATEKNMIGQIRSIKTKTWFDCHMAVSTRTSFPAFEVLSNKPPIGAIAQQTTLPHQSSGNAAVDAKFAIKTNEPGLAQLLGEHLTKFSTFDTAGVHLVGADNKITYVLSKNGAPILGNALYYAENMAQYLTEMARAVGG